MITLIVAHDDRYGIGKNGDLPWPRNAEDMKHFRETTTGGIVIMGRKTYESIPQKFRPLPDRINIVVSSSPTFGQYEDIILAASPEDALFRAKNQFHGEEIFVAGGGTIYEQLMPKCDRIIRTIIPGQYDADTHISIDTVNTWTITRGCIKDELVFEELYR